VTTIIFGNCGVGFAPVKRHHRQALMDLMEAGTWCDSVNQICDSP
jgi:N-acyl-D-aspartate/D-glutamate deacylase